MLNTNQKKVVEDHFGLITVAAGPGSGKTRVLIERAQNIVSSKECYPSEILMISFTNKVKYEIKQRMYDRNPALEAIEVHTFHSFAIWALRKHYDYVNLPKNFMILDEEGENELIGEAYLQLGLDKKVIKIREMRKLLADYNNNREDNIDYELLETVKNVSMIFEDLKKIRGYLNFDDLLYYLNLLLKSKAKSYYADRFKFIMIDEAQDLNKTQFMFIQLFRELGVQNILLVGDFDQAIYEWRGAKPELFKSFYDASKKYQLNINYRSSELIVEKAKNLINYNQNRVQIDFKTVNGRGNEPVFKSFFTSKEQKEFIINEISNLIKNGESPNEIAILYRSNYLSSGYERELFKNNIKYIIYNGVEFFERKEVKDALALLKISSSNADYLSFWRVLKNIQGIGDTTINKIKAVNAELPLDKIKIALKTKLVSNKVLEKLENFLSILELSLNTEFSKFSERVVFLVDKLEYLSRVWADDSIDDRKENFMELLHQMDDVYNEGKDDLYFIELASLYSKTDEKKTLESCIKLMTMHSSKGLEFKHVFIVDASEGIIPTERSIIEQTLEQERRLMYVAMTRAKERLTITSSPPQFWQSSSFYRESRFIKEANITAFLD